MKFITKTIPFLILLALLACGGNPEEESTASQESKSAPPPPPTEEPKEDAKAEELPASQRVDLTSKGIGPIKSLELPSEIDQAMVAKGMEVYKTKCTACHKPDKRLIGPAPQGIMTRRTPEWIMNMILNPDNMVKEDPLAKELFMEFNGSPMSNQNLTEEEARAILEYFRTL